jgi:ABC-2 type transport system ATP-binding protein
MTDTCAIEADGLGKAYGAQTVLDSIDLQVARGSVYALLGPNGAGKTTTVRILATLARPDAGWARVAGYDVMREPARVRRAISLTGQYAALDDLQTGAENLRMLGQLARLSRAQARQRAAELLAQFDLEDAARRTVSTYSGGMRRRLDLAASLMARPEVIFLDEPTTGLDPRSRQAMWHIIGALVGSGVTVFLTTQYLDEADQLADRIGVMDGGRSVAEGTPAELKQRVADQRLDLTLANGAAYVSLEQALAGRLLLREPTRLTLGVASDGCAAHIRALLDEVDPSRLLVRCFAIHSATLDDVFLALTGHAAAPEPEHMPGHTHAREQELANV